MPDKKKTTLPFRHKFLRRLLIVYLKKYTLVIFYATDACPDLSINKNIKKKVNFLFLNLLACLLFLKVRL